MLLLSRLTKVICRLLIHRMSYELLCEAASHYEVVTLCVELHGHGLRAKTIWLHSKEKKKIVVPVMLF